MKELLKYFINVRVDLLILLACAIFTYFIIELVLIKYDEIFSGAYEIGQFCSILSIAYISAFIFYFIVVHLKNEKDKENVNEWVGYEAYSIITSAHLFIQPLQQRTDKKARFEDLELEELRDLLRSVERNAAEAPYKINDQNATWLQWYEHLKNSSENSIKEIFSRYTHLDSKLIKILSRIENSLFFYQWSLLYNFEHDSTFGIYEFQIRTYLNNINDLKEYADKNFKQYQYRTSEFIGAK